MKTGYYKADTINGVYFYDTILDEPETEVINPIRFYQELKHLEESETLTTFIGPESEGLYNRIQNEYGIN